jgi:branched-chain amino acid transport system substrate-binding protein
MTNLHGKFDRRAFLAGASAAAVSATPIARSFAQTAPLKVGVVHPSSGFMAAVGQQCNRGAEIAPAILRDMGYPAIELMFGDTESNPDVSRTAGERLIQAGAQILVGAFDSGQTTTLAQAAEQHGIPLVINIAGAPQITEQGYKFVFRNFPRAPDIVTGGLDLHKTIFTTSGKTPNKAICLYRNDTYGNAIKGALGAIVPKYNMPYEIADFIGYDPQARDLSVEVAKAKASGAEIVIAASVANDAVLLTREMVKQRFEPWGVLSAGPGWYEPAYRNALGKYGNYVISSVPWYDPRKKLAQRMLEVFTQKFPGELADTGPVYTFEAILIVADAYKRAGSAAPQALADALRATNIPADQTVTVGNGKGISFDAKGQVNGIPMTGVQNLDGLPKVVLPEVSAEAKLIFPVPGWSKRA